MNLLKSAQQQPQQFDNHVANFAGTFSVQSSHISCFTDTYGTGWIIDSGATDHMCLNKFLFNFLNSTSQIISISLPNDQFIDISSMGTVHRSNGIILTDILYVPSFKYNLISISKLTQQLQCNINFVIST